jgi:hypothetical protein
MNNKPVAWTTKFPKTVQDFSFYKTQIYTEPLYTHPVKEQGNPVAWRSQDPDGYWSVYQSPVEGAEPLYTGFKELTDEEIRECIYQIDPNKTDMFMSFARAILRKAQKK